MSCCFTWRLKYFMQWTTAGWRNVFALPSLTRNSPWGMVTDVAGAVPGTEKLPN